MWDFKPAWDSCLSSSWRPSLSACLRASFSSSSALISCWLWLLWAVSEASSQVRLSWRCVSSWQGCPKEKHHLSVSPPQAGLWVGSNIPHVCPPSFPSSHSFPSRDLWAGRSPPSWRLSPAPTPPSLSCGSPSLSPSPFRSRPGPAGPPPVFLSTRPADSAYTSRGKTPKRETVERCSEISFSPAAAESWGPPPAAPPRRPTHPPPPSESPAPPAASGGRRWRDDCGRTPVPPCQRIWIRIWQRWALAGMMLGGGSDRKQSKSNFPVIPFKRSVSLWTSSNLTVGYRRWGVSTWTRRRGFQIKARPQGRRSPCWDLDPAGRQIRFTPSVCDFSCLSCRFYVYGLFLCSCTSWSVYCCCCWTLLG